MSTEVSLYLLNGAIDLLGDLHDKASNIDSIDRAGQESALYKDRIIKGRLAHFSVASKKRLENNLISAIMNLDTEMRTSRRPGSAILLLRNRKKRFKK